MRIHKIKTGTIAAAFIAILLQGGPAAISQSCTENTGAFTEEFSGASYLDLTTSSVQYWYNHPTNPQGIMTLNKVGANFGIANPNYVPAWINALTSNDFDLDGWPDYVGTSSGYGNVLAFVRNRGGDGQIGTFTIGQWIDGSTGDASGWPLTGVGGAPIDTESYQGITSGDYDGDGDFDFLTISSQYASPNTIERIWLYENRLITNGINTGVVSFVQTNLLSAWAGTLKGLAWSSTSMVSIDLDYDGDMDVAVGNREGDIFKLTNTGSHLVNASTFVIEPIIDTGWGSRGVSTISIAEFDDTPGLDMIVGSVSTADLHFYQNDGHGNFELAAEFTDPDGGLHDNMYDGAATVSLAADFDRDGDQDFIIGTDNWNYGGYDNDYGGKCYYFRNDGDAAFVSTLVFNGQVKSPRVYDFDIGCVFDFDNDGDLDFLMADGNHSQYYYMFINVLGDVYNTKGIGYSLNLTPTLSSDQYAITKARMTRIDQRVMGGSATGLTVDYYVSNNNGQNWELYAGYSGSGLINVVNQPWHSFQTFGTELRWKAVLNAPIDPMAQYTNASFETPVVDMIGLEYVYVERREYSRSSAAVSTLIGGDRKKLLISASFMFPGLEGQLRAYDVTNIPMVASPGSAIQTISASDHAGGRYVTPPGSILWDAGALLESRTQSSRTIYAGYKTAAGAALQRVDFTEANVGTLGSRLQDPDSDNAGLIRFIRGEGRNWKLGDILHSSPVVLGPPSGDTVALGASYAAFVSANETRQSVIFLGANDGMLHCFNTSTGQEMWGYIPYNLLPKLKNLSRKDPYTGARVIATDLYVDGVPVVGDAYINGAWRTVLVCGQGAGKGSSISVTNGLNYYFALDVTDPSNPSTLWEITAATTMGESWSVPAIGKVRQSSDDRWVAFVGSGYDNHASRVVGNSFYVIRLDTGAIIRTVTAANVNTNATSHPNRYTDIYNAIPGSPTAVDINRDGKTDYVYVGDLDGRLYRMDVTGTNTTGWNLTAIYTDRINYPIVTRPAVWLDPTSGGFPLRVFFGTGGDDRAPVNRYYAILALKDEGSAQSVEWYLGNTTELGLPALARTGGMEIGEKIWADPVVSDSIVYISSLKGSIENVNPCLNLGDLGLLYARFVQSVSGSVIGGTALKTAGGLGLENIQLASKARKAVTVGDQQRAGGKNKREIYVQEYDSTIERLEQPIQTTALRVISWREIYKIIR